MKVSIKGISSFLQTESIAHEYYGNDSLEIEGFCALSELKPRSMAWIKKIESYNLASIESSLDLLIITDKLPGYDHTRYNLVITSQPKVAYFEILRKYFCETQSAEIAPTAVIKTKKLGRNVSVGHNSYICANAEIGNNVTIKHNVVIECPTIIGDECVIGTGTVIGSHGFGYYEKDGVPRKVPDFGGVIIGNRVEIGASVCVARGTLENTIIEDDVKIDSFSYVAHNAQIGARSYIVASLIGGSCTIGQDTYIAPGTVIKNQITIGNNSFVGMGSVVNQNVEENQLVIGNPAKVVKNGMRYIKAMK